MIRIRHAFKGALFGKWNASVVVAEEQTRALHEIGLYGEQQLQKVSNPFTNTGRLEGSMSYRIRGQEVRIGTPVNYGTVVLETGMRKGVMPPIAPLKLWVMRKLQPHAAQVAVVQGLLAGKEKKAERARAVRDVRDSIVTRVAWAVAVTIKRRGLRARHLVTQNVFPKVLSRAGMAMRSAAARITKRAKP